MPSKMRYALLIGMTMIALLFATVIPSYAETVNYVYDELNRLKGRHSGVRSQHETRW